MSIRKRLTILTSIGKTTSPLRAAAYLYIGGLIVGTLRADLMTNWHAGRYDSLIALHNDVAKNSLQRSVVVDIPRNISFATTQNKGKAPVPMPSYKCPHINIGQISRHVWQS